MSLADFSVPILCRADAASGGIWLLLPHLLQFMDLPDRADLREVSAAWEDLAVLVVLEDSADLGANRPILAEGSLEGDFLAEAGGHPAADIQAVEEVPGAAVWEGIKDNRKAP